MRTLSSEATTGVEIVDDLDLVRRAVTGYWRYASRTEIPQQPSAALSLAVEYRGKNYVILRDSAGVLAIYRVLLHGRLKRLKRWPTALEHETVSTGLSRE